MSEFSPEYERDVLTAMFRHPDIFADYQEVIEPSTFGIPAYKKLWFILQEFYRNQKELPTPSSVVELVADKEKEGFFLDEDLKYLLDHIDPILNGTPVNEKFVLDKLITWVKDKRLRKKVTEAIRKIESKEADVAEVIRIVKEAEVSSEIKKEEREEDFAARLIDHVIMKKSRPDGNIIPTGLPRLDEVMGGGPKRGYKNVLMGPPGGGKTTTAMTICSSAVQMGLGALYCFNDDTEEEMFDRFAGNFSGIPLKELVNEENFEALEELQKKLQRSRGELGLKQLELYTTPSQVRRIVERRLEAGHPVDVLVVDHIRNMRSDVTSDSSWYDIGEIFLGLASIAIEFNLVMYVVMHTKRTAEGKHFLDNSYIGLSYEPVKDANLILAIWRLKEDFSSQGEDAVRMQITKHRGGPGTNSLLRFGIDFERMCMTTVGDLITSGHDEEEIFDPSIVEQISKNL
jgi:replicative DNA helicase